MNTSASTIGLIAGNGTFPLLFARAAHKKGMKVFAVAMRGETDPSISAEVEGIEWVRVGQLGKMIRAFQRAGIREAAMAGGVKKTRLFGNVWPDLRSLRLLWRHTIRPDDGMLRAVAKEFEQSGITIVDSTLYMPDALTPEGVLTTKTPSDREWEDLNYGFRIAREIGKLDIGQTVVVKNGAVVALEAIEGTDACITRAGELTNHKGAVIVKVAKPNQDLRFDLPAVGASTIVNMAQAGIHVLGMEAGKTLMLEPERVLQLAEQHQCCLVGLISSQEKKL